MEGGEGDDGELEGVADSDSDGAFDEEGENEVGGVEGVVDVVDGETCQECTKLLEDEVKEYRDQLNFHANSKKAVQTLVCKFCPWRKFDRKQYLVQHVDKYHKEPYFTAETAALKRKSFLQFRVVSSLYRQSLLSLAIRAERQKTNFLAQSAELIRGWNLGVTDEEKAVLEKSNGLPLVTVVEKAGPQLWLKSQTGNTTRLTDKVYYTKDFEDLAIAITLQSRGKVKNVLQALRARWAESACAVALLMVDSSARWLRKLLDHVFTHEQGEVQNTIRDLKHRATERGEWVAISHDATYKCLFSLVGQEKMTQKNQEFHAAHTFIGVTGACPGFSPQRTEGNDQFGEALHQLFTPEMRNQVRLLYTDSPGEAMLTHLPNAIGCAEDSLHLVIRCEYCCGEKRNACTRRILELQSKFLRPIEVQNIPEGDIRKAIYHGEPGPEIEWDSVAAASPKPDAEWKAYGERPYQSHREYVAELKAVATSFPDVMGKKDSNGRTVLQILQAAATLRHYQYLRNGSLFRALAGGVDIKSGTTMNEAEHRGLKRWAECIYTQHQDRLRMVGEMYALYRMLGNAYKNTFKQRALCLPDRDALFMMSGMIVAGKLRGIEQPPAVEPAAPTSRLETKRPQLRVDPELRAKQRKCKDERDAANHKQTLLDLKSHRKKLAVRLRSKVPINKHMLKPGRRKQPRPKRVSRHVRDTVEQNLAAGDP